MIIYEGKRCYVFPCDQYHLPMWLCYSRVPYSLDPDQAQHFVGSDLAPKCL